MRFRILGPVEVCTSDGQVLAIDRPLRRAVLAYLLLHANRVVPVDQLIDAVWGGAAPVSGRVQVQTAVSRIRLVLRIGGRGQPLETRSGGYRLAVADGELDLEVFEQWVAAGRAAMAAGRPGHAVTVLREALGLWDGPALGGTAAAFVEGARAGLQERRLAVYEDLVDAAMAAGDDRELLGELAGMVEANPFREPLAARLMQVLYRSGGRAEALEVYGRLRTALADQLGIDPGQQVRELHEAMLRGDPALEAATYTTYTTYTMPPIPAQLPASVPDFTGRVTDLAALDALLPPEPGAGPARVVAVITGAAGAGKTALAIQWAHRVADRFGDGQLYLNLRGYSTKEPVTPIEALGRFLRALGVPAGQIPVDEDEAGARYRTELAGRHALVVLDNAGTAEQVRPLLPGTPGCAVLVTSRDRLDGLVARDGAWRYTLGALTGDDATALLGRIIGADRVGAEPEAAAGLAEACAHLPLALRIAAAHLAANPGATIARYRTELAAADPGMLGMLAIAGDPRTAVRAAFELSYAKLAPDAQRLFRLLGLVPGPDIGPAAAACLAGVPEPDAHRLLDRLAATHLVDRGGEGRCALHDLLRAYARDLGLAAAEEGDAALGRLLDWYLRCADAAVTRLSPKEFRLPVPTGAAPVSKPDTDASAAFADADAALAWLDTERANLVATVRLSPPHLASRAALLAHTLRAYLPRRGYTVDWLAVATAAVPAAATDGLRQQAAAQLDLGWAYSIAGRFREAAEHCAHAVTLARQSGWRHGESVALDYLGNAHGMLGQLDTAATHLRASIAISREIGAVRHEAAALHNLAMTYQTLGRFDAARAHLIEMLAMPVMAEHPVLRTHASATLADVLADTGRYDEALDRARAALADIRELGDRRTEMHVLCVLGTINRRTGRYRDAVAQLDQALRLADTMGDPTAAALALVGLADAHHDRGHPDLAQHHAEGAVTAARRAGSPTLEAQAASALARAHLARGNPHQAIRLGEQALDAQRRCGYRLEEARTLVILGHAHHRTRGYPAARPWWRQAQALLTELGSPEADEVHVLLRNHPLDGSDGPTAASPETGFGPPAGARKWT